MPKTTKWLTSREYEVRCPHCKHPNDFREIAFESGLGKYEKGMTIQCGDGPNTQDPKKRGCDRFMQIVKVEHVHIISVRAVSGPGTVPIGGGS